MQQQGKLQQMLRNNTWSGRHAQVNDPGCRPLLEWRRWSHNVGPAPHAELHNLASETLTALTFCGLEGLNLSKLQLETAWENPASHLNVWDEKVPACLCIMPS